MCIGKHFVDKKLTIANGKYYNAKLTHREMHVVYIIAGAVEKHSAEHKYVWSPFNTVFLITIVGHLKYPHMHTISTSL